MLHSVNKMAFDTARTSKVTHVFVRIPLHIQVYMKEKHQPVCGSVECDICVMVMINNRGIVLRVIP